MANTAPKKKSASSGGKRTAPAKGKSGSGSGTRSSSAVRRNAPPPPRPIRREVGAAVCLFLALFAALGYFGLEGLFINLLSNCLKGLMGWAISWRPPPCCWGPTSWPSTGAGPCGCGSSAP